MRSPCGTTCPTATPGLMQMIELRHDEDHFLQTLPMSTEVLWPGCEGGVVGRLRRAGRWRCGRSTTTRSTITPTDMARAAG